MARLNIGNLVKISPHGFVDNFETGWFIDNSPFTSLFTDNFENNWFIDNIFTLLFLENFEDISWD